MKFKLKENHNRTGIQSGVGDAESMKENSEISLVFEDKFPSNLKEMSRPYHEGKKTYGSLAGLEGSAGSEDELFGHFMNKIGERIAFERTGTRLYDALIRKVQMTEDPDEALLDDLHDIREDEARHFRLLNQIADELKMDPTSVTPDANAIMVASSGILKVITDARSTVPQAMEAILTAELADHDGWEMLIKLAERLEFRHFQQPLQRALQDEERHLAEIKEWLETMLLGTPSADVARDVG